MPSPAASLQKEPKSPDQPQPVSLWRSQAEEINKEFPDSCKAYPCDVADYAAVQETVSAILKDFPQIDILVNNAGITRDSLMLRMKEEDWDAVMDTNLKSSVQYGESPGSAC